MADRFDDEQGTEQDELTDDATDDEQEEEPELTPEQQAYLERRTAEREAAVRAEVRERLQAQGLDYTGDGAAIRDLNVFAGRFGFATGQQSEQATNAQRSTPNAEVTDPYEALGERPDPTYDEQGARDWDRRYRAVIKAEALAELAPQIDEMRQDIARSHVTTATERVQRILSERGFGNVAEHPDFAAEFSEALLAMKQPMSAWSSAEFLTGVAGFVIPRLKPAAGGGRQEPARGDDGRFRGDANRRSLDQISAPRDQGRAPSDMNADPMERELAEMSGMTIAEWRASKDPSGAALRQLRARRNARGTR